MRTSKRDRPFLTCYCCNQIKPSREFYVSNLSICMVCKRNKVNEYKRRTGYNLLYRNNQAAAQNGNH